MKKTDKKDKLDSMVGSDAARKILKRNRSEAEDKAKGDAIKKEMAKTSSSSPRPKARPASAKASTGSSSKKATSVATVTSERPKARPSASTAKAAGTSTSGYEPKGRQSGFAASQGMTERANRRRETEAAVDAQKGKDYLAKKKAERKAAAEANNKKLGFK